MSRARSTGGLSERLQSLEETQRATLNILDDFSEERSKLARLQQATMNILDDAEGERQRSRDVQRATVNLLEDVHAERNKFAEIQRALMNMLEDIEVERANSDRANKLLASANQELEAFSYSISHDLQAPLRAIGGFAQAVVEDAGPKLDPEGRRHLAIIQENAHKMGQLIHDLLGFSRLGRQAVEAAAIDMEALARAVFEALYAQTPDRHVRFAVQPLPAARGDPAMIRQVWVNLLDNALKYTRPRETAVIEVGFQGAGDAGAYYVKDNGVGFDMRYVGKLFGVFQRLHTAAEGFEGTGVGLALAHRIITRHGGRVWAEGAVQRGATLYFTLPGVTT